MTSSLLLTGTSKFPCKRILPCKTMGFWLIHQDWWLGVLFQSVFRFRIKSDQLIAPRLWIGRVGVFKRAPTRRIIQDIPILESNVLRAGWVYSRNISSRVTAVKLPFIVCLGRGSPHGILSQNLKPVASHNRMLPNAVSFTVIAQAGQRARTRTSPRI